MDRDVATVTVLDSVGHQFADDELELPDGRLVQLRPAKYPAHELPSAARTGRCRGEPPADITRRPGHIDHSPVQWLMGVSIMNSRFCDGSVVPEAISWPTREMVIRFDRAAG